MSLGTIKILDHPSTVKIIMKVVCLDLADVCDFFHSEVPMGYCGLRGGVISGYVIRSAPLNANFHLQIPKIYDERKY